MLVCCWCLAQKRQLTIPLNTPTTSNVSIKNHRRQLNLNVCNCSSVDSCCPALFSVALFVVSCIGIAELVFVRQVVFRQSHLCSGGTKPMRVQVTLDEVTLKFDCHKLCLSVRYNVQL